jgi:hypothetical protein
MIDKNHLMNDNSRKGSSSEKLELSKLFVSGGFFFKYNENNFLKEHFPQLFEKFKNDQAVDFFYTEKMDPSFLKDKLKYDINFENKINTGLFQSFTTNRG